jgi:hypothetical protein
MTYKLTKYVDIYGRIKWRVHCRFLFFFWRRIMRPLELADGMTDPFSEDEALELVRRDSRTREAILSTKTVDSDDLHKSYGAD